MPGAGIGADQTQELVRPRSCRTGSNLTISLRMSEVLGWIMVVAFAVVVAAVPMVAFHVRQESRRAFEATVRDALARLEPQLNNESQRRLMQANRPTRSRPRSAAHERRAIARRRLEDVFPSQRARRLGV